jgi:hypothetical protein
VARATRAISSKTVAVEKKWGKEGKEKGSTVSKSPYVHRWPHH